MIIIDKNNVARYGLKYNEYSGAFTNVIDMDALFD